MRLSGPTPQPHKCQLMLVIHELYVLVPHLSYRYLQLDMSGNRAEANIGLFVCLILFL